MAELETYQDESKTMGIVQQQEQGAFMSLVSTAQMFPRPRLKQIMDSCRAEFEIVEVAEGCYYTLPPRKNKDGKLGDPISGFSVRLAEIAVRHYHNLHVKSRIIDIGQREVIVEGAVYDSQSNTMYSKQVSRSIMSSKGYRYSDDMIRVTTQAALSIAVRNAVAMAIPRNMLTILEEEAREIVANESGKDSIKTKKRIERMILFFSNKGIGIERILKVVNKATVEELTPEDVAMLAGMATTIREGHQTVEEMFPVDAPEGSKVKATESVLAGLGKSKAKKPEEAPNPSTAEAGDPSAVNSDDDGEPLLMDDDEVPV